MKKFALILVTAALLFASLGLSVQSANADDPVACFIGRDGFEFKASEW